MHSEMKLLVCLGIALICLNSAFAAESCLDLPEELETCNYQKKLTLISSPRKNQVDSDNCNAEYDKGEWQEEPTVLFPDADPDKTYTLLNVDPDPPRYDKGEFYLHWLVSNIRGEDFIKGDLTKANHLQAYYGPAPPQGSGLHRYMFIAFEEDPSKKEVEVPTKRSKFDLVRWLRRQENLCGPVAGIQFRTQY